MKTHQPKISIITVVYNDVNAIEKTIRSVITQTYPNIEYIIIDGGSVDGTKDIISKYQDKIAYWISEPDKGIYYAMNKGLAIATGDWVNFMNSGDWLYSDNTVASIFEDRDLTGVEMLYGNTDKRNENGSKIYIPADPGRFWKKLMVHQSIFSRIELNRKYPFDTRFKVSADFDFIFKVFFFKYKTLHLNITVSSFDLIGYSHHNRYIGFAEDRKIALKYKGDKKLGYRVYCHYIKVTGFGKTIDFLKSYTPNLYRWLKTIKD